MKKSLAVFLALLVLLSVFPPGLAAEEPLTFVIEALEALPDVGEEFTVTVRLENNPGFNSLQFSLVFDDQALTCTKVIPGEMLLTAVFAFNPNDAGRASLTAACLDAITVNDVIATFTIRVDQATQDPAFHLDNAMIGTRTTAELPFEVRNQVAEESGTEPSTPDDDATVDPGDPEPTKGPEPTQEPEPTKDPEPAEPPEPTQDPDPTEEPDPAEPPAPVPDFTDVKGHWGEEAILRSVEKGLFKGYPDNTFRPDEPVTRAQFVTVLWRLSGSPEEKRDVPFTDTADQYAEFQSAIAWGYHQGYVKGTSDSTFSPENTLTRQEALTILHRLSGSQVGMEAMFTGIYDSQFSDSEAIAPWAKAAMYWGVYRELIQGVGGGQLSPTGVAGRAQIAKIVLQYQTMMKKEGK